MTSRADISLLFDLFVTSQRVRRVLSDAMAESGMRPDEYAVYSVLFDNGRLTATEMSEALGSEGHVDRMPHPGDGRALQLHLTRSGVAAHRRAHDHWEVVRKRIEGGLSMPAGQVRRALQALGDAASVAALPARR